MAPTGTARPISVRVRRVDLIKAIEAHDKQCQKDYEQAAKAYKLAKSQWPAKMAAYFADLAKKAKADPDAVYASGYKVRDNMPPRPSQPRKPTGAQKLIDMLKLGSEEKITISEAQFRQYLDSCAL